MMRVIRAGAISLCHPVTHKGPWGQTLARQETSMISGSEILLFKMLVQWSAESITAEERIWWDIWIMMNGTEVKDRCIMVFILK